LWSSGVPGQGLKPRPWDRPPGQTFHVFPQSVRANDGTNGKV
jgi:hypothetical protein